MASHNVQRKVAVDQVGEGVELLPKRGRTDQPGAVGPVQLDLLRGRAKGRRQQNGICLGPAEVDQQRVNAAVFSTPAKLRLWTEIRQACLSQARLQGPGSAGSFAALGHPPVKSEMRIPRHNLSPCALRLYFRRSLPLCLSHFLFFLLLLANQWQNGGAEE